MASDGLASLPESGEIHKNDPQRVCSAPGDTIAIDRKTGTRLHSISTLHPILPALHLIANSKNVFRV